MIYNWVINGLVSSICPLIYICYHLYKDNKKQKHQIDIQNKLIDHLNKKYGL